MCGIVQATRFDGQATRVGWTTAVRHERIPRLRRRFVGQGRGRVGDQRHDLLPHQLLAARVAPRDVAHTGKTVAAGDRVDVEVLHRASARDVAALAEQQQHRCQEVAQVGPRRVAHVATDAGVGQRVETRGRPNKGPE